MGLFSYVTASLRSELYDYSSVDEGRLFLIQGTSVIGDVPDEIWTFVNASTAIDNGTTVIRPTEKLVTDAGRWILKRKVVKMFGSVYSKEWKGSTTVSGSTATFDISSAGFGSITDWTVKAFLSGATITNMPIAILTSKSNTSITITLVESKTTNTLLLSSAEGLELHAVAGTEVYLTVQGN